MRVFLNGRFRIEASDGTDLTPRGAKDCGLIALLVTSRSGERTRPWLQSKLWSDRGAEQAANSLRQSVVKIRKALGPYQEALYSTRQCVGLDMSKLEVHTATGEEFLEGIDIRDEAFEDWLRLQRSGHGGDVAPLVVSPPLAERAIAPPEHLTIKVGTLGSEAGSAQWISNIIADMVSWTVSESYDIKVTQTQPAAPSEKSWQVTIDCALGPDDSFLVRLELRDLFSGHSLWSMHRTFVGQNENVSEHQEVIGLVQELVHSLGDCLMKSLSETALLQRPDALCALGIQKLFSMESRQIGEADTLFSQAYDLKPRGLYLAWRAHVREIELVERVNSDHKALKEESEALLRRAFESEPQNSMVLALLAINRLHMADEIQTAFLYARRAVRMNYGNAMAWWALSATHLRADNPTKSYGCARMAVNLSFGTPLEFWTQSQLSGAAMAVRKLSEAKALLKNVAFGRPDFRPPLRYLLALHATDEEWVDAVAAAERLKILEPGFSIEQLANDRDYPVSLLHKPYGLDRQRLLRLI